MYYLKKRKYDEAISLWEGLLKNRSTADKKSIAENLIDAHYEKGLNAEKNKKIDAVDEFLVAYDRLAGKLDQEKVDKWSSKKTYFEKTNEKRGHIV